jgi:hypothetical protein
MEAGGDVNDGEADEHREQARRVLKCANFRRHRISLLFGGVPQVFAMSSSTRSSQLCKRFNAGNSPAASAFVGMRNT